MVNALFQLQTKIDLQNMKCHTKSWFVWCLDPLRIDLKLSLLQWIQVQYQLSLYSRISADVCLGAMKHDSYSGKITF